jgi:hypothetical protein
MDIENINDYGDKNVWNDIYYNYKIFFNVIGLKN